MKALILNTGIISSIGANTEENLASLMSGRASIGSADFLKTRHSFPVGEIKWSNEDLAVRSGAPAHWPRTALLSLLAAKEAWNPFAAKASGLRIAFISANTVGGMDITEQYYAAIHKEDNRQALEQIKYHECGAITDLVVQSLGLNCWSTTLSTACSSSANSIMLGAKLIAANRYDIVIAGGADSLSAFTLNGFNSLMILDKYLCQPFDENRKGLNLGEAAAYLVLSNEKAAQQLDATPIAYVSGYANANDAHHQTASSPEGRGNKLAMKLALEQAGISAAAIDYINLHGTGTQNNDASEGAAITALFEEVPPSSSTKAFTGHTLGAAGAVEAVFSTLSIREQKIWPHLRMQTKISHLNWAPVTSLKDASVRHVLSNSFGFGGNCSSLIISKHE